MSVRLSNAALDRMLAAAETDPAAVQRFLPMMNMVGPRPHSFHPATALRATHVGFRGKYGRNPVVA